VITPEQLAHALDRIPPRDRGERVSLGCLRTHSLRARWLIETVPLGAAIFIRA
jgi:hypothetical protein